MLCYWTCAIGPFEFSRLPNGADGPLRQAVQLAFQKLTGSDPLETSTGWGSSEVPDATIERLQKNLEEKTAYITEESRRADRRYTKLAHALADQTLGRLDVVTALREKCKSLELELEETRRLLVHPGEKDEAQEPVRLHLDLSDHAAEVLRGLAAQLRGRGSDG